ncbi:hypothetical protein APA79_19445 [Pseudomonas aeruginosa]|nr:hypothetical protein APA79_19445 [Pseudomonas aeruginosa]
MFQRLRGAADQASHDGLHYAVDRVLDLLGGFHWQYLPVLLALVGKMVFGDWQPIRLPAN